MKQYTVVLIDEDHGWRRRLAGALMDEDMFLLAGEADEGAEASSFVAATMPDILILDIVMAARDGAPLLKLLRNRLPGYEPIIYAMARNNASVGRETTSGLTVDCYSMKPLEPRYMISNLKKVIRQREGGSDRRGSEELTAIVEIAMRNLGIPLHLKSTQTTIRTLEYIYLEQYAKGNKACKMRDACNEVALKHASTYTQVEKSLRSSAGQMSSSNTEAYRRIFEFELTVGITSRSFVSCVCRYIDQLMAEQEGSRLA